ncbi:uncharacterized protein LOC113359949 [Papaver somniferum]|uniref:uncharacterized protein LOC113359949 n=1 Tax=Papaver somniferum TaxID=3469 RepID=UPI000E6FFE31|nr:uncharacterized protein LOC113359949 [Papaver somniferum]
MQNGGPDATTKAKLEKMVKKLAEDGEDDKLAEVINEAKKTPFTQDLEQTSFPPKSSLEGESKNWFYTSPDESIRNYGTLVETFLEIYMHNSIARPRINKRFTLARRFRELLRSLTDIWRKLCTDIGKVPVDQQIFGFENSLGKSDPIWIAMYTEKPQTLKEMRKMQEHYIALEEIQEGAQDRGVHEASTTAGATPQGDSKRSEKRPMAPQQGSCKKEWVEKGKRPRHDPRTYTPLNTPLEEIFKEVENKNDIRYPKTRGIQFNETRNHPEFFHYHQYRGNLTNNCREVKDIVQHIIRDGYLRYFVKQTTPKPNVPDAPVHQVRIDRGTQFVCNTISQSATQGFDLGTGITSRIHKRDRTGKEIFSVEKTLPTEAWMMQPITFSAKDVPMNGQAHGDPLVITLLIEKWGVKRILVDSGSSVEVLFYDTFKRMELSDDILIPSTYQIYGFNGTVTVPKGEVTLKIFDE